jgi:hypothetical protein
LSEYSDISEWKNGHEYIYKGKVIHVLKHIHTVKLCGAVGVIAPSILNLSTRLTLLVIFMRQLLYLREIASDTNCIGDWVDPGANLYTKEKRKTFTCVRNETPVVQPCSNCTN